MIIMQAVLLLQQVSVAADCQQTSSIRQHTTTGRALRLGPSRHWDKALQPVCAFAILTDMRVIPLKRLFDS
jgi:hypothetical protein